jgi:hypothetical protein
MKLRVFLLTALILTLSQTGLAQSGPKVQFDYVQTNILAYPGSPFASLPFIPYLSVVLSTGEAGDGFLMEISFTDSRGVHQTFPPQFVKRVNTLGGAATGANIGVGLATVPVGPGVSDVSIKAWNIRVSSDSGQSQ